MTKTPEQLDRESLVERLREIAYRDEARAVTVRTEDLRAALALLTAQPADNERVAAALRGLLEIGKRDTTNPKYDGFWNEARAALAAQGQSASPAGVRITSGDRLDLLYAADWCEGRIGAADPDQLRKTGAVLRRLADSPTGVPDADARWLLAQLRHNHNEFSHDYIKDEQRCDVCKRIKSIAMKLTAAPNYSDTDSKRLDWLALHPRPAQVVVDGEIKDCIFWGIASAPENTLREAIDAAVQEKPND